MSEKMRYLNQNMIKLNAKRRVDFKRRAYAMRVSESSYSYTSSKDSNAKGGFWSSLLMIFYSSGIKSSSSNKTGHFFLPLVCLCLLRSDIGNSLSSPPSWLFCSVMSCSESKLTVIIGIYMISLLCMFHVLGMYRVSMGKLSYKSVRIIRFIGVISIQKKMFQPIAQRCIMV